MIYVDRFSDGLDDMRKHDQRSVKKVLAVLADKGRFSVFEATENETIAGTMGRIVDRNLVRLDTSCGYPWTKVELTESGCELLKQAA